MRKLLQSITFGLAAVILSGCFGADETIGTRSDLVISSKTILAHTPVNVRKTANLRDAAPGQNIIMGRFNRDGQDIEFAFRLYGPLRNGFVVELAPFRAGLLGSTMNTYGYLRLNDGKPAFYFVWLDFKEGPETEAYARAVEHVRRLTTPGVAPGNLKYVRPRSISQVADLYEYLITEGGLEPFIPYEVFEEWQTVTDEL